MDIFNKIRTVINYTVTSIKDSRENESAQDETLSLGKDETGFLCADMWTETRTDNPSLYPEEECVSDGLSSDEIIDGIPSGLKIDGSDCVFNLSLMEIEGKRNYVVTYERKSDGWVCGSFSAITLRSVLLSVASFIDGINNK